MPLPPGVGQFNPMGCPPQRPPFGSAAGYGLELPVDQQRAQAGMHSPQLSLEKCVLAAQGVLEGTMGESKLAPWHMPPVRSRMHVDSVRVVLNVSAAVDAAANTAGLALALANSPIVPITVLTPGVNESLALFSFVPGRSSIIRIKCWGITVENSDPEALRVGVTGGTIGGPPSAPNPSISGPGVDLHQDAFAMISENKQLDVTVQNVTADPASLAPPTPLLITFGVCWWEYVVSRYTDNPERMRLKSGFGTDCA